MSSHISGQENIFIAEVNIPASSFSSSKSSRLTFYLFNICLGVSFFLAGRNGMTFMNVNYFVFYL